MKKNNLLALFISSLLILSCASVSSQKESTQKPSAEIVQQEAPIKIVEPVVEKPEAHPTPAAHTPTASHHEVTGVEPAVAQGWLKNGNIRFLKRKLRADGQAMKDIKRLSKGQHPHTVVISCSDSRVPPEILFDQKLGEIFVIRTAGEAVDAMSLASLEYALSHLGARHVLVLGHTHCGAVKAACSTLDGGDAGSESLNALVKDIHPRIQEFRGKTNSAGFIDEVWANTKGVAKDLENRSSIVSSLVQNKSIQITSAVYDIETGAVAFK